MMSDAERRAAFLAERRNQLKRITELREGLYDELIALLEAAEEKIQGILLKQPSDYQNWILRSIQGQIEGVFMVFNERSQEQINQYAADTYAAGIQLVDEPLRAAGINLNLMPNLHPAQLGRIQDFMGERLKDVSTTIGRKINNHLGLTMMGAQNVHETINQIQEEIKAPRWRAKTIVRTELGGLYNRATQDRMTQVASMLPGLQKEWRKSKKNDPRANHVAANGQKRNVDQPFDIGKIKMMQPHDKSAPKGEIINCGCTVLPYMANWQTTPPAQVVK